MCVFLMFASVGVHLVTSTASFLRVSIRNTWYETWLADCFLAFFKTGTPRAGSLKLVTSTAGRGSDQRAVANSCHVAMEMVDNAA